MGEALILIVNNQDKPIGAMSKDQAQNEGLIHRLSRVMLEDSTGNVLLQRRASGSKYYPNCWDSSAAGHVDEGEDYEVAALRELEEEIGLSGVKLKEIGYYYKHTFYQGKDLKRFNKVYKGNILRQAEFVLQQSEVSEVGWFTKHEFSDLVTKNPDSLTEPLHEIFNLFYA